MVKWVDEAEATQEKVAVSFPLAHSDFPGAQAVAVVFKLAACLVLVAGGYAAEQSRSHGLDVQLTLGIVASTILGASVLAFFGYVLQLLLALHFNSRPDGLADEVTTEAPQATSTLSEAP